MTVIVAMAQSAEVKADVQPRRRHIAFWVSVFWVVVLALAAFTAPWLPFLEDPDRFAAGPVEEGPSWSHWFGTDQLGRDMFSRVVWGSRLSLGIAFISVGLGLAVGGTLGVIAGFYGRWIDTAISSVVNVALSLPALVFALFIVTVLGQSFWNVTTAVSILAIPGIARITRAQALRFCGREFVVVAHAMGAKQHRVLFREVLPNVVPAMASFALLAVAIVIVAEGGLSFIGKSVAAPDITWGGILAIGKGRIEQAPHIAMTTSGVMFVTLLALNFIGDELLKRLDVREARL